jgi:hypothetical protein
MDLYLDASLSLAFSHAKTNKDYPKPSISLPMRTKRHKVAISVCLLFFCLQEKLKKV